MIRSGILVAALLAYALVLGCVVWSTDGSPRSGSAALQGTAVASTLVQSRHGLPYCAIGIQVQRTDWIDRYKKSIDEVADVGADTVKLVVDARQENTRSAKIYLDLRMTPTPDQLAELIGHAKSRNLRVILMPIVLLDNPIGTEWRGRIAPLEEYGGWDTWWSSYRDMLKHYSWIAEGNGVDVLVIGSELISTEDQVDEWVKTIQQVRQVFKGRLTYSSNWDHYTAVHFWDQLDLIGMNSYWKFGSTKDPSPPVEQIVGRWREIQSDLLDFVQKTGKPLLFLEVGWFSQNNVTYEPWDYTQGKPIDLEVQSKLYEGFFQAWWGNPNLGGFSIWEWPPGDGGPKDDGYTPKNKPAEKVLRQWLAKPRWDVR